MNIIIIFNGTLIIITIIKIAIETNNYKIFSSIDAIISMIKN